MEKDIDDIITDLLSGEKLSSEEQKKFEEWYSTAEHQKQFYQLQCIQSAVRANQTNSDTEKAWEKVRHKFQPSHNLFRIFKYAAILLLPLCISIVYHHLKTKISNPEISTISETILPGKKQAVLTLSNGKKINLTDRSVVVKEKSVNIYNNGKNLQYNQTLTTSEVLINTVLVPRGGEYRLILADGTSVWLNSDSRISYPVAFTGNIREVHLEGEAFFEVRKDSLRPFIVHTQKFDIRVLGTQFNVRTYPEENQSVTLAQGSIQMERGENIALLHPSQQAVLENDHIKIREVNLEEAIAWRNNAFCFKQCPLENILNELARWYDFHIFYQNPEVKNYHFTAWFTRSSSITDVIQILEKTQKIKLELKEKTLTIKANNNN